MSHVYTIVPYDPSLKQGILELLTDLWSPSIELNQEYFAWKHERNPYTKNPLLYIALCDGKPVGMRSFFGVQWEGGPGRQKLSGLYADDLVIAREHRQRGLIDRIMRTAFVELESLGYEYLFSLSAGPATMISALTRGWRLVGDMQPLYRSPLYARASRALRRLGVPAGRESRSLRDIDAVALGSRAGKASPVRVEMLPPIEAMVSLLEALPYDGRLRHVRDATYLRWRLQNPQNQYGFLLCGRTTLDGYLVLQERKVKVPAHDQWNIVDWEAVDTETLDRLLEAACHAAGHDRELSIWTSTLSPEKLLLVRQRFHGLKEKPGRPHRVAPFLIRPLTNSLSNEAFTGRRLADLAEWDLRMLYSMHG